MIELNCPLCGRPDFVAHDLVERMDVRKELFLHACQSCGRIYEIEVKLGIIMSDGSPDLLPEVEAETHWATFLRWEDAEV